MDHANNVITMCLVTSLLLSCSFFSLFVCLSPVFCTVFTSVFEFVRFVYHRKW